MAGIEDEAFQKIISGESFDTASGERLVRVLDDSAFKLAIEDALVQEAYCYHRPHENEDDRRSALRAFHESKINLGMVSLEMQTRYGLSLSEMNDAVRILQLQPIKSALDTRKDES